MPFPPIPCKFKQFQGFLTLLTDTLSFTSSEKLHFRFKTYNLLNTSFTPFSLNDNTSPITISFLVKTSTKTKTFQISLTLISLNKLKPPTISIPHTKIKFYFPFLKTINTNTSLTILTNLLIKLNSKSIRELLSLQTWLKEIKTYDTKALFLYKEIKIFFSRNIVKEECIETFRKDIYNKYRKLLFLLKKEYQDSRGPNETMVNIEGNKYNIMTVCKDEGLFGKYKEGDMEDIMEVEVGEGDVERFQRDSMEVDGCLFVGSVKVCYKTVELYEKEEGLEWINRYSIIQSDLNVVDFE